MDMLLSMINVLLIFLIVCNKSCFDELLKKCTRGSIENIFFAIQSYYYIDIMTSNIFYTFIETTQNNLNIQIVSTFLHENNVYTPQIKKCNKIHENKINYK